MQDRKRPAWLRVAAMLAALALVAGCASTGEADRNAFDGRSTAEIIEAGDQAARRGEYRTALMLYNQAREREETPELYFRIAAAHMERGNLDGAANAYHRVLEDNAEHAAAREALGLIYLRQRRSEPAREHLELAIATGRASWRSHNGLGVLADVDGEHEAAMEHFRRALDEKPGSITVLNNMGYSLLLAGALDEAERTFSDILERGAYEPATMNLALVYARRGEYRRAVAVLSTVIAPEKAHNDIGFVALTREDFDSAERLFGEAIRLAPRHYETAQKNLAMVRAMTTERDAAGPWDAPETLDRVPVPSMPGAASLPAGAAGEQRIEDEPQGESNADRERGGQALP